MKATTRSLIINTASDLFYKKGYNLTGINEIIAKSGIAKATLYSHFSSKEELCLAYLDARDSAFLIQLEKFCTGKRKGNPQLLAVLEFLIPVFEDDSFNGCWCSRTMAEVPKDNDRIRARIKTNKLTFLALIEKLVAQNKSELSPKKVHTLSKRIYLLYEAAVTESHLHCAKWPIDESIGLLKIVLKAN